MIKISKEDMKLISSSEKIKRFLYTAVHGDYITGMLKDDAELVYGIYNRTYQKNERFTACSKCQLNICKTLGRQYETQINEQKQKKNAKGSKSNTASR